MGNKGRQAHWLKSIGDICTDLDTNGLRNTHFGVHAADQISRPGNYIYFCLLTSAADNDGRFGLLDIQFFLQQVSVASAHVSGRRDEKALLMLRLVTLR